MSNKPNRLNITQVLSIAQSRINSGGFVVYHDFDALKPAYVKGGHYLFQIKNILTGNGYVCHERANAKLWGTCGYKGQYTHFHKRDDARTANQFPKTQPNIKSALGGVKMARWTGNMKVKMDEQEATYGPGIIEVGKSGNIAVTLTAKSIGDRAIVVMQINRDYCKKLALELVDSL